MFLIQINCVIITFVLANLHIPTYLILVCTTLFRNFGFFRLNSTHAQILFIRYTPNDWSAVKRQELWKQVPSICRKVYSRNRPFPRFEIIIISFKRQKKIVWWSRNGCTSFFEKFVEKSISYRRPNNIRYTYYHWL